MLETNSEIFNANVHYLEKNNSSFLNSLFKLKSSEQNTTIELLKART